MNSTNILTRSMKQILNVIKFQRQNQMYYNKLNKLHYLFFQIYQYFNYFVPMFQIYSSIMDYGCSLINTSNFNFNHHLQIHNFVNSFIYYLQDHCSICLFLIYQLLIDYLLLLNYFNLCNRYLFLILVSVEVDFLFLHRNQLDPFIFGLRFLSYFVVRLIFCCFNMV